MTKYGAHTFLWVDEWTTEKGNYAITETAKVGFDFIEISLLRPEEFDPRTHKQALKVAGIEASASLVLPEWAHMPEKPKKAMQFLFTALEKLEAIGCNYLGGCIAFSLGKFSGKRNVVIDTMGEVALVADRMGITLGIEVVNRYESNLFNTLAELRETILKIGVDNIKIHADTYHMLYEEEGFYQPLVDCQDVLGYMHMSENHRGMLGKGTVNWDEVFLGLSDANYSGPMVVKSFPSVNPDLAAAIKLWRPPNQTPEFLAREGLRFLKEFSDKYNLGQ
jgi:D-psicose/D-tagatose/L-ribulose 3-epimerase